MKLLLIHVGSKVNIFYIMCLSSSHSSQLFFTGLMHLHTFLSHLNMQFVSSVCNDSQYPQEGIRFLFNLKDTFGIHIL